MKKVMIAIIAVFCSIFFLFTGCSISPWIIVGAGQIIEKEYALQDFDSVVVSNTIEVEVTRAENYHIKTTGFENLIERLDVFVSGKTLTIRLKPGSYSNTNIRAYVAMPELSKLTLSGASRGTVRGFSSTDSFDLKVSGASQADIDMETGTTVIDISGASRVTGNLKAQDTRLKISGASRCELTGRAGNTRLDVSGASQANLEQFPILNTEANVSGASRANIYMNGTLDLELSGASFLEYSGQVILKNINISGASSLRSK